MIAILTQASYEPTTELVMEWLTSRGYRVERINADDLHGAQPFHLQVDATGMNAALMIDGRPLQLAEVSAVWFRRWRLDTEPDYVGAFPEGDREFFNLYDYKDHLQNEFRTVSGAFFSLMSHARWLGLSSAYRLLNKLVVLQTAARVGLTIPPSLVTASPDEARQFQSLHGELITKPMSNLLMITRDERLYMSYTDVALLGRDGEGWQGGIPSLFQKKLSKRYELRCFYLDGACFTMVTLAEAGHSHKVDWRQLQSFSLARRVPYKLPLEIEEKIRHLMTSLDLDTGSVDLIRTTDGAFVFLEVNPVGQFGMTSAPCNYHLEEQVAQSLIERSQLHEARSSGNNIPHQQIR